MAGFDDPRGFSNLNESMSSLLGPLLAPRNEGTRLCLCSPEGLCHQHLLLSPARAIARSYGILTNPGIGIKDTQGQSSFPSGCSGQSFA